MPINSNSYKAKFISEDQLKEDSLINENMDMKMLSPLIKVVQDIYLSELLGTSLFADLQDKIVSKTLNSDELFLLEGYIRPLMIWGVLKQGAFVTYKYTNKGVQTQNSDNSQPAPMNTLDSLADKITHFFNWYSDRLMRYLIANQGLFPAYRRINTYDDKSPKASPWSSRIALGNVDTFQKVSNEGGSGYAVNLTPTMFAYLNTNIIRYATSHTNSTATFSGSFLGAPNGIPFTSVSNFQFYVNSGSVPPAAINSFTNPVAGTCSLSVDTVVLGYQFQPGDTITAIGKFQ